MPQRAELLQPDLSRQPDLWRDATFSTTKLTKLHQMLLNEAI